MKVETDARAIPVLEDADEAERQLTADGQTEVQLPAAGVCS